MIKVRLRIGAGTWRPLGEGNVCSHLLVFFVPPYFKMSHLKMYCQQTFPFVQLPYRFLILNPFPSSMQSTFSKHSSNLSLLSVILNLYDENLTSFHWQVFCHWITSVRRRTLHTKNTNRWLQALPSSNPQNPAPLRRLD